MKETMQQFKQDFIKDDGIHIQFKEKNNTNSATVLIIIKKIIQ